MYKKIKRTGINKKVERAQCENQMEVSISLILFFERKELA